MKVVKIASEGKILCTVMGDQLIITDRVQAPEGMDLSNWIEFNNEYEARFYFGIFDEKEDDYFVG